MARLIFALMTGFASMGMWHAAAEQLHVHVTSSVNEHIQIHFYSETRHVSWPGAGISYDILGQREVNYNLNCDPGEHICYGAWVKHDPKINWGVGLNKAHACRGCCYYCDGGTAKISLRP